MENWRGAATPRGRDDLDRGPADDLPVRQLAALAGDVVLTGTPEGVAALASGDRLTLALNSAPVSGIAFVATVS